MSAALQIINDPDRAAGLLHPLRQRILGVLASPDSAAGVARQLDLPRQKVNYHLRELERDGFVELVEERKKGNCVERVVRASATAYVIDPALAGLPEDGGVESADRFSSAYLVAASTRAVRDVATLRARAASVKQTVPTITIETEVRFASAADRGAFAEELTATIAALAAKYHDETAPRGRPYRFVVGGYPKITKTPQQAQAEAEAHAAKEQSDA